MPGTSDTFSVLRRTALIATLRQCRMFADLCAENLEAVA